MGRLLRFALCLCIAAGARAENEALDRRMRALQAIPGLATLADQQHVESVAKKINLPRWKELWVNFYSELLNARAIRASRGALGFDLLGRDVELPVDWYKEPWYSAAVQDFGTPYAAGEASFEDLARMLPYLRRLGFRNLYLLTRDQRPRKERRSYLIFLKRAGDLGFRVVTDAAYDRSSGDLRGPDLLRELLAITAQELNEGIMGKRAIGVEHWIQSQDGLRDSLAVQMYFKAFIKAVSPRAILISDAVADTTTASVYIGSSLAFGERAEASSEGGDLMFNLETQGALREAMRFADAKALWECWSKSLSRVLIPAAAGWMNMLGGLSEFYLSKLLERDPRRISAAFFLLYAWPGTPVLFSGDEVDWGDARRGPVPRSVFEGALSSGYEPLRTIQALNALRGQYAALRGRLLTRIDTYNPAVFAAVRSSTNVAEASFLALANLSGQRVDLRIKSPLLGRDVLALEQGVPSSVAFYPVEKGEWAVTLEPFAKAWIEVQ